MNSLIPSTGSPADRTEPALSPAFIQADDAARYAHERIGNQRDKEYGGYLLQRDDGLFIVTEPIAGQSRTFDHNEVFLDDDVGNALYPDRHQAFAVYHSHPAFVATPWSAQDNRFYINFFSAGDMLAVIADQELSAVSYLSGPDGSLIRYTASGSALEAQLLVRVAPADEASRETQSSQIQQALIDGSLKLVEFVRLVAEAGDLTVVVPSDLWGQCGRITAQWSPYPDTFSPCRREQLVLGPAFKHPHDAALYAHRRRAADVRLDCTGLILENPTSKDYVCTEPLLTQGNQRTRTQFKPQLIPQSRKLPPGYRVFADYYSTLGPPTEQLVLERDFFALERLLTRLAQTRSQPFYVSTAEGALLEYSPQNPTTEQALVQALGSVTQIREALERGEMQALDLIRRFASLGGLRVLAASRVWRQQGRVDASWLPFAELSRLSGPLGPQACDFYPASQRPAFGPVFTRADDAARYAHRRIGTQRSVSVLGCIFKHLDQQAFLAAEPFVGLDALDGERVALFSYDHAQRQGLSCLKPSLPSRYRLHSLYFAHGPDALLQNFFNPRHLCLGLKKSGEGFSINVLYLSAADGALLSYQPASSTGEKAICQRPQNARWWDNSSQTERALKSGTLELKHYIQQLAAAGALSVLETSPNWPQPGVVSPLGVY